MENEKNICPECGAESTNIESSQKILQAPFGSTEIFIEEVFECKGCGYEFDDDADGLRYEATYQVSVASSIPAILQLLDEKGYSMVATERILELPFRTLSRWKNERKVSAGGYALLRMLATFPWLLEVADKHYEREFADDVLMSEGAETFNTKLQQNNMDWYCRIENSGNCLIAITPNNHLLPENQILQYHLCK